MTPIHSCLESWYNHTLTHSCTCKCPKINIYLYIVGGFKQWEVLSRYPCTGGLLCDSHFWVKGDERRYPWHRSVLIIFQLCDNSVPNHHQIYGVVNSTINIKGAGVWIGAILTKFWHRRQKVQLPSSGMSIFIQKFLFSQQPHFQDEHHIWSKYFLAETTHVFLHNGHLGRQYKKYYCYIIKLVFFLIFCIFTLYLIPGNWWWTLR